MTLLALQLLVKLSEVDTGVEDSEGNTPAHLAAAEGHLDCLRLLVYHKHQPMDVVVARNNDVSHHGLASEEHVIIVISWSSHFQCH